MDYHIYLNNNKWGDESYNIIVGVDNCFIHPQWESDAGKWNETGNYNPKRAYGLIPSGEYIPGYVTFEVGHQISYTKTSYKYKLYYAEVRTGLPFTLKFYKAKYIKNSEESNYTEQFMGWINVNLYTVFNAQLVYDTNYNGTFLSQDFSELGTGSQYITLTKNLSNDRPSREGYTFLGWSWDKNATTASMQPGDSINLTSTYNSTVINTIYAIWHKNSINNVKVKSGGNWVQPNKVYAKQGDWKEVKQIYCKSGGNWHKTYG